MPFALVQLGGLVALLAGLAVLQAGSLGFSVGGAVAGVLAELPTTFPAGLSIALATAMDLAAGAVLIRLVRWSPYGSFAEAALGGLIGAVAKDTTLLLALGSVGHFQPLAVALVDIVIIGGGIFLRPFVSVVEAGPHPRSASPWILPAVLWAVPVIVQLAAPVVPSVEILPNHVAPIEHIRTYASYSSLAVSPSPLYGPSGIFLGYVATVGSIATLTDLPAVLAVGAFTLPLAVLLAAASYHVARTLGGRSAGYWALLMVPLSVAFLRLPEASAIVLAAVPTAAALTLIVPTRSVGARSEDLAGRSRPALIAAALGAVVLIHPIVGAFAIVAAGLIGLLRSAVDRRAALAGVVGSAVISLPQLVLMSGIVVPAWAGLPGWPLGLLAAAWLGGPGPRRGELTEPLPPARSLGWIPVILGLVATVAVVVGGTAYVVQQLPGVPGQVASTFLPILLGYPVLTVVLLLALAQVREIRVWSMVLGGLAAGSAGILVGVFAPPDTAIGTALHTELLEVAGYWMPWIAAVAGGLGLAAIWTREAWPWALRGAICALLIVAAAVPFRPTIGDQPPTAAPSAAVEPREHPYAETAGAALHQADQGYWTGYPDSRRIVADAGVSLIDAIRDEQAAGRMRPSSELLHVVPGVEPWVSTPLAVFTGVIETILVPDLPTQRPSEQGRIVAADRLGDLLGPERPYLVIERASLDGTYDALALGAGYASIGRGDGWQLYHLSTPP